MDLINEMKNLGADMDSALERFMGKSQLLEMMLKNFPIQLNKTAESNATLQPEILAMQFPRRTH